MARQSPPAAPSGPAIRPPAAMAVNATLPMFAPVDCATLCPIDTPSRPLPSQTMQGDWCPSTQPVLPHSTHSGSVFRSCTNDDFLQQISHGCSFLKVNPVPEQMLHSDSRRCPRSRRLPRPLHATHLCGASKRKALPSHKPHGLLLKKPRVPRDSQKGHGTVGAQLAIVLVLKLQVLVSPLILDGGCQHPKELARGGHREVPREPLEYKSAQ